MRSREDPVCLDCGGRLEAKDWVERGKKEAGGHRLIRLIERRRCTECGRSFRLLPDDQVPHKHYSVEVIEKVIEDDFTEEELLEYEEYPCDATVARWKEWFHRLVVNAEGIIRSAAHRVLELSDRFLSSTESLLEGIKDRISLGWLSVIIVIIVNEGGVPALSEPP